MTFFLGFVALLAMSIIQVAGLITGDAGTVGLGTLRWVLLAYPIAPAVVYALFFNMGTKDGGTVPGAVVFDHDVIEGAPAARFSRRLVELIESGYGLDEE